MATKRKKQQRNGKLSIPLPFDEAMKAAVAVEPPKKPKRRRKRR